MTWSLALQNGDLQVGNSSLSIVTGQSKLFQDLGCNFLTPLGSNDVEPSSGSIILGGIDSSGTVYSTILTQLMDSDTLTDLSVEIQRVLLAYQNQQLTRAKQDMSAYGKTTLTKGEVILSINDVDLTQVGTTINVNVSISTAEGITVVATIPTTTTTS